MMPDNGDNRSVRSFDLVPLISRLKIQRKDAKIVRLTPNWAQQEFLQVAADQMATTGRVRIITLKARQLGLSTISQALLFQLAFLTREYSGLVIAHEVPASQNLLKMTHRYWDNYDLKRLYTPKHLSKNDIGWVETGSNIKISTAGNKAAGRSATIHYLHASEMAFWPEPETTFLGLRQTVPSEPGTVIVVESTANGVGNFFHTMWEDAVSGDSEFVPLFFPWWRHYEYRASHINLPIRHLTDLDAEEKTLRKLGLDDDQLTWRRWAIRELAQSDVRLFDQEYPSCVIGSTRVGTDEGIVPIADMATGTATAFGEVVTVHQYTPTPTFTATTELGYRVTGTDDHPIFDESGLLVPLAATEGRTVRLAAPRTASTPYTVQWSELGVNHSIPVTADLAEFLGLFVGDGSYSGNTLSIVCDGRDTDVIVRVEELFRNLFGLTPRKRDVGSKNGGVEIRASSVGMKIVLDKLGVLRRRESDGGITRNVCVPEAIWRSPGPIIQRFLAGLFEADGFNSPKVARVTLFSKYEQFLADVQLLLLSQGITSRRVATEKLSSPDANGVKHTYTGSELNLRASESRAFNRTIGFLSERKTHNIPVARGGRPAAPIRLVDKVVSVTPAAIEPVYDLTVDTGEAFDANGIHTHNTPEHAFLSSGTNIFPEAQLRDVYEPTQGYRGYLMRDGLDMTFQPSPNGSLTVYKAPSRDTDFGQYLVAGDPTHTCYSDDTEVLTDKGWRLFTELDGTERFATRAEGGELQYQHATEHINEFYSGDMYRVYSQSLDLFVTPNHRMLTETRAGVQSFYRADELPINGRIPRKSWWVGEKINRFTIPKRHRSNVVDWSGDDYCAFMGMYLAEGNLGQKGRVEITQRETSKGYTEFKELLDRLGIRWSYSHGKFAFTSILLHEHLEQFGKALDKYVPENIRFATPEQIEIFWHYFWLGDGSLNRGCEVMITSSPRLRDDLQELTIKLGDCGNYSARQSRRQEFDGRIIHSPNPSYIIRRSKSKQARYNIERVEGWSGRIVCVTVPNGTLYVRRNGKAAWCGNTRGDYAVAQVINRRNMEQVAVWRGRVDPASFGEELFKLGMYYNTALVVSEIEGPGYATIGKLLGMNYPRVYRKARPDHTPGKVSGDLHGWSTTMQSKHLAIGWLLKAVVDGSLTLHHPGTYTEMKNYVSLEGGGYGNGDGSDHDDTVMAMAMAVTCHMLDGPIMAYGQNPPETYEDYDEDWEQVNQYLTQGGH